jgi:hypothetical protein
LGTAPVIKVVDVPGDHFCLLQQPDVPRLSTELAVVLKSEGIS